MEVLVLNTSFESVGIIDEYESLIWTDRYQECGDFELTLPVDRKYLSILQEDYYLWTKESEHCMIIEDIAVDSDLEEGNRFIVTGRSLESIIDRRIIWGQEIFRGNLQEAVHDMLIDHIMQPIIEDRQISNFIFLASEDTRITNLEIDEQYFGDSLYDIVKNLCEKNRIGFKITLNNSNQFVFSLYVGEDRSYDQVRNPYVVFSPKFENIINSNYFESKAKYKNVALVAGEGEGSERKTAVVGTGIGLQRRELFTDARDVSSKTDSGTLSNAEYMAQLEAKGEKELAKNTVSTAFEGEVDATHLFKYGEDFFIGDIVQIANEYGHEGVAFISELVISQDKDGLSIYPTFKTITEEVEDE